MKALDNIGLSAQEQAVYVKLLARPDSYAGDIRKSAGIVNSQVYIALQRLVDKGLIQYVITAKGKKYTALNPAIIETLAKERYESVKKSIPQLKAILNTQEKEVETAVFEGIQGFTNALHQMAQRAQPNETIKIIGFSNQAYKSERLRHILQVANRISRQKKHRFHMILDSKDNQFIKDRKREGITELRFVGKGFTSPAAIDIFQDYVYIFMWDEKPFAFMLKSQNIAEGFKSYFNFLWAMSRE